MNHSHQHNTFIDMFNSLYNSFRLKGIQSVIIQTPCKSMSFGDFEFTKIRHHQPDTYIVFFLYFKQEYVIFEKFD